MVNRRPAKAGRKAESSTESVSLPSRVALGWSPFHTAAKDYYQAGYLPIPLPEGKKYPPPKGVPNDVEYNEELLENWLRGVYPSSKDGSISVGQKDRLDNRHKNLGCIVPDGTVVFDVDGPAARETLKEMENELGPLPPTWSSFRGDPNRFHLWYTVPSGLIWPGKLGAGIDVIYRHYRYMVLPPSIHPDGGQYRWANLRGDTLRVSNGYFPSPDEFADLSETWLSLANGNGYIRRDRAQVDSRLWIKEHGHGDPCPVLRRILIRHQKDLRRHADLGGMHDAMVNGVWAILAEISAGHRGGYATLRKFRNTFFAQAEESGRRDSGMAEQEWSRACIGAIEKTAVERVRQGDPCIVEENERGRDPDRFFDPKHGLKSRSLRASVEKTGKLAVGPGKQIYRHTDGLWVPDGESEIYRRSESLLQQRWRPSHAENVRKIVEHREPFLTDDRQDTDFLNVPNGLLNWRTGELIPHNAGIVSTIRIPIEWNEDAECPDIDEFFGQVFPSDAIELAYEILGYMLFNDNPLHKAILLYGSGRNGKGTFLRLARMLVGHANISAVTPQALDSSQFSSAQLYGKLANLVGDVDPRIFKSTEQFKQLTGGDYMMAQHKHKDPFTFRCRALMVAAFNALPRTADTTEGFFSRWVVIPFTAFFPAGKADPSLIDRLTSQANLQGLLRGAVGGLQQVMRRGGFIMPASVENATRRFRMEADPMRGFIEERIKSHHSNDPVFINRTDVYTAYTVWANVNGFQTMSTQRFYESFVAACVDTLDNPIDSKTRKGIRGFVGISIM
jgi:P4 family phage/plasmid primase-like protien